jgi:hypothetical protein
MNGAPARALIARVQPGDQCEGIGEDGHRFCVPRR